MCDSCPWYEWLDQIRDMIEHETGAYDFANDTLEGIATWVYRNKHITRRQIIAVQNIKNGVESAR